MAKQNPDVKTESCGLYTPLEKKETQALCFFRLTAH